ncbi:MAG: DUF3096 domain-containing protein [Desulfurococcaceae archaeon]
MAEEKISELIKRYLGISIPRIFIGIIMLVFGALILAMPDLLAVLVALYLLINGIVILVDEIIRSRALKSM